MQVKASSQQYKNSHELLNLYAKQSLTESLEGLLRIPGA